MSPERRKNEYDSISFEDVARLAKETTLRDGVHVPLLVMNGTRQMVYGAMPELPDTHHARMQFMYGAGHFAGESGGVGQLKQVFFISEAWMSVPNDGNPPKMRPSEDPNRKEVLIIQGFQIQEGTKHLKLFEMIRNRKGHLVDLKDWEPQEKENGVIDIPLLEAFSNGFRDAFQARMN
jgi:hypothetical protein